MIGLAKLGTKKGRQEEVAIRRPWLQEFLSAPLDPLEETLWLKPTTYNAEGSVGSSSVSLFSEVKITSGNLESLR